MKKLIKLVEEVGSVDTTNYPNIKWGGSSSLDKINLSLLSEINASANAADITVTIGTANSGHSNLTSSGVQSRHKTGEAVDINKIDGIGWSSKSDAESKKILSKIEGFVGRLRDAGYKINSESGNLKSVLYFGFPGHNDHIHVSSKSDEDLSKDINKDGESTTVSSAEKYAKNFMIDLLAKPAKKMFGINENKQIRIIKNIDRIKQLLK
jgi:hypothetical protein